MRPTTFFKFQTLKQEKECSAHFLILTNKETQVHNLENLFDKLVHKNQCKEY